MSSRPCKSDHTLTDGFARGCHLCKLARTEAAYRAWDEPAGGEPVAPTTCPHLGGPTGERRECDTCGGRVKIPVLSCSLHGECTASLAAPGVACCKTCDDNPARAPRGGYYPATRPPAADPWRNLVTVPPPPPVVPKTAARRAVVTVVAGDRGRALWDVSGPTFRSYAARLGAELVVITWPGNPAWPMSAKFGIGPAAAAFDEILYADADVLFQPGSLDLFALRRSTDELLAFDDLPHCLEHWTGMPEEYQRVRESQKMPRAPVPWYLNTGLVVMSRHHAAHVAPPAHPIPPTHCAEQHLWNARAYASGTPVRFMTEDQHWQWWVRVPRTVAPPWAVLHFSGMRDDAKRLTDMAKAAARW